MTDYNHKIIDNALPEEIFSEIEYFFKEQCLWNFNSIIASDGDSGERPEQFPYFMLVHTIYNFRPWLGDAGLDINPQSYNLVKSVFDYLEPKPKAIARIKANLYPNQNEFVYHNEHRDYKEPHRGAILYINTNNGFTVLEDGTKIESIRNRLLLFDSSQKHRSTNCTDDWGRLIINFNYF